MPHRRRLSVLVALGLGVLALGAPAWASSPLSAVSLSAVPIGAHAAAQPPPSGPVTFGARPASATAPDDRAAFKYGSTPGAVLKDFIAVSNVSTGPLSLQVYASDAFNTPEGGLDLLAGGTPPRDVGAWTRLERDSVQVAGRSTVIVPFTVTIPADASPGDHVGGIVASLRTEQTTAEGQRVAVDQRVGSRIYLRVAGELRAALVIEGLDSAYHQTINPVGPGSATVTYTVRNTGNIRLRGAQRAQIRAPWGSVAESAPLAEVPELLPGNALQVTAQVPSMVPSGWPTSQVQLEPVSLPGDENPPLRPAVAQDRFAAVPVALLIVLALAIVLALLWRRRRRGPGTGPPTTPTGGATAAQAA